MNKFWNERYSKEEYVYGKNQTSFSNKNWQIFHPEKFFFSAKEKEEMPYMPHPGDGKLMRLILAKRENKKLKCSPLKRMFQLIIKSRIYFIINYQQILMM